MNTIVFVGDKPPKSDPRSHAQETWVFVYCTSGQGAFRFADGRVISYCAGDLVAISSREIHTHLGEDGVSNIYATIQEPSFPYTGSFKVQDENGSLCKAMEEARAYYLADKAKRELVLMALGELIVSYMIVFRSNSEFSEPVEQIRSSILQNYTRVDYALDAFIHSLPFHYDYLRKVFKKEIGMSPLEYMTSLRMKNAERMLSAQWTSRFAIAEIAQSCGFENALYFSRVFKKYYGCSPSQYARKYRENHPFAPADQQVKDD